jgi:hypothetical protein
MLTFTDPSKPASVAAFSQLVVDQIPTLIAELSTPERDRLRDRPVPATGPGARSAM